MDFYMLLTFVFIVVCLLVFNSKTKKVKVVSDIIYYPVKSCAGIHLLEAEISDLGLKRDREWAVVDENKQVISLREEPRLYRLQPKFEFGFENEYKYLVLTYPKFPELKLPLDEMGGEEFEVELGKAAGRAVDIGPGASKWLSMVFEKPYSLVKIKKYRKIEQTKDEGNFELGFADEAQVLVASEESYEKLCKYLPKSKSEEIPISNFRPNIIVKNCEPFDEDNWKVFEINGVVFQGVEMCYRCRATTVNFSSAEMDKQQEPLKTLRKVHGKGVKAYFGLWAVKKNKGSIHVKDKVNVVSREVRNSN